MKTIEIKEIGPKSLFKTVLYISTIPLFIVFLIALIGSFFQGKIFFIILPYIFVFIVEALISMLIAVVYNWFAKRYGGLELKVHEKELVQFNNPIEENNQ